MFSSVKGAAIGIDLGTTYSCVAVWSDVKNRIEIISNEQGNRTTPSCVAFNNIESLLGEGAKNQIARNPTNTLFTVKRLIGNRFSKKQVQEEIASWPFKIVEGHADKPMLVLEYKGEEKEFAPEEISAMILKKMKEAAEAFLGTKVTDAVITVPAYFNNNQRAATKDAGKLAGLNVLRLINEPTAAAIAYGIDNMADSNGCKESNVLVFDLGGGTFDVSLLTVAKSGAIDVKAVGGDTHLGGEDFDETLIRHCIKEFKRKHKEDMSEKPRALGRLKVACEKAKRDLSSTTQTSIEVDCLHQGIDFFIKISQAKFEELNVDLFSKCIDHVDKCLRDAKMDKKNVDEVVVVGGSTRIPKVQRMLEEYFDGKTFCKNMYSDEAVAYGATVLAAKLSGKGSDMVKDVILLDVTPLSLGVRAKTNSVDGLMSIIIPRNTPIPTSEKRNYSSKPNQQSGMDIGVYQGESNIAEENIKLDGFILDGLTPAPKGPAVEICFDIDVNGILLVSAKVVSTGLRKNITITNSGNLSNEEIDMMLKKVEK